MLEAWADSPGGWEGASPAVGRIVDRTADRTADQQAAQTAAYEPYGRLSQYGQGLTGLSGGVASQQYAPEQSISPMSQAVGTALGVGGLYGKIFGFPGDK